MFYCEPCKTKNSWPGILPTSYGLCEVCGETAACYDVPSSALPRAESKAIDNDSPERRHAVAEIPGEGPDDRCDRDKMLKPETGAPSGGYPGSPEAADKFQKALSGAAKDETPQKTVDLKLRVERIVAAAVQIEGVTISLPQPARHGTVMAAANRYLNTKPGLEVQGFLTSAGRFVNRIQARHIADIAGQKPGRSGGRDNPELYSEDLW